MAEISSMRTEKFLKKPAQAKDESPTSEDYFFGKWTLNLRNQIKARRALKTKALPVATGELKIQLEDLSHPDCREAFLIASVEGNELEIGEDPASFKVSDPLTDIKVHVYDNLGRTRQTAVGRIVIPLSSVLAPNDISARAVFDTLFYPIKRQIVTTHAFLPPGDSTGEVEVATKFRPAFKGIPGSGQKRKHLVGKVVLRIQFKHSPVWSRLLRMPYTTKKHEWFGTPLFSTKRDHDEANWWKDLNPKDIKANKDRLTKSICTPTILARTWTDVRVMAAALLVWYCFYRVGLWTVPLYILGCIVLNGILARQQRCTDWEKQSAYLVYTDEVGQNELLGPIETVEQLQELLFNIQQILAIIAAFVEMMSFAVSCGDPLVSALFYLALVAIALIVSLSIALVPPETWIFLIGCLIIIIPRFVYPHTKSVAELEGLDLEEKRRTHFGRSARSASDETDEDRDPEQAPPDKVNPLGFLARIPNDLEMAHRFIAHRVQLQSLEVVYDGVAETGPRVKGQGPGLRVGPKPPPETQSGGRGGRMRFEVPAEQ